MPAVFRPVVGGNGQTTHRVLAQAGAQAFDECGPVIAGRLIGGEQFVMRFIEGGEAFGV